MNIILLTEEDKLDKDLYTISDGRATHIRQILKSEVGHIIEIGLLNGPVGKAEILDIDESKIIVKILTVNKLNNLERQVDIILALPRPQTLKKVLNIASTMGITNLYLIRSSKVEKSYFHSPLLKKDRYTKFLIEGLSQGKRTQLPVITIHKRFKQFFENNFTKHFQEHTKLLAHTEKNIFLNQLKTVNKKKFVIAFGPEGGWNDFEVNYLQHLGFNQFKISNSILRVETALTATLAQLEMINV